MQKITKREKILLYVLLLVVLVCVGVFLMIMPAMTKHDTLQAENQVLQAELASLKGSLDNPGEIDAELEKASIELALQQEKFFTNVEVEDVDGFLTTMVQQYGLSPISLNVSEPSKEKIMNYSDYLEIQVKTKTEEDISQDEVDVYNVSFVLDGTITNLQRFINDANATKTLRVAGVNYSASDEESSMSVTFKLYVI